MGTVRIYHNPWCSKSRATLALLRDQGIEPEVVEYLNTPFEPAQLSQILDLLKLEPRQLMRRQEAPYREDDLAAPELSKDALIAAMIANPILIERPIVLANGKAALGRPPEAVLEIL